MTVTFTNQPLATAFVPLFVGSFPRNQLVGYSTWRPFNPAEGPDQRAAWWWVWGLYRFRNSEDSDRWCMAETRMLLGQHIHDFCGGVLASSGGTIFTHEQENQWSAPRLGTLGASHLRVSHAERANVPSIHDALRAERSLSRREVAEIMDRSLMYWALARMIEVGKRGIFAFDRAANNRSKMRNVMRTAAKLQAVPNFTCGPVYDAEYANRETRIDKSQDQTVTEELLGATVLGDDHYRYTRAVAVNVHEAPEYLNSNSGSMVGAINLSFSLDGDHDDEAMDEIWDEELEEYVTRPIEKASDLTIPDYWRLAARTPAYLAQQPVGLWNNG
jgi:hypothetical protein